MNKWKSGVTVTVLAIAAMMVMLLGCGAATQESAADTRTVTSDNVDKTLSLDEQAEQIVASMSRTEKLGQLIMIGVHGTELNDDSLYMLTNYHMGGVIYFDRNIASAEQLQKFSHDMQAQAEQKVPLFIGIDEEGGRVTRGAGVIEAPPSQEALGNAGNPDEARAWSQKTARNLKELGINVNFAPVADVGTSDTRSYGSEAGMVTDFVRAAAEGYEQENMLYVLKHFPGIGKGLVDSHQDVSEITANKETLEAEDLLPFKTMIDEKSGSDYFILVSHLKYPALDTENPASQSKAIMTDLLRNQLGYQGIVVTDDMEMGAVANYEEFRQMGVKAILAGADIVLVCHEYEHEQEIYAGLDDAMNEGILTQERVDESVKRIVKAKLAHIKR